MRKNITTLVNKRLCLGSKINRIKSCQGKKDEVIASNKKLIKIERFTIEQRISCRAIFFVTNTLPKKCNKINNISLF